MIIVISPDWWLFLGVQACLTVIFLAKGPERWSLLLMLFEEVAAMAWLVIVWLVIGVHAGPNALVFPLLLLLGVAGAVWLTLWLKDSSMPHLSSREVVCAVVKPPAAVYVCRCVFCGTKHNHWPETCENCGGNEFVQ